MSSRAQVVGARLLSFGLLVLALELVSLVGIALAPRLIGVPIVRTARMERAHAAQIRRFLAEQHGPTPPRIELDSVLGWRYRAGFARGGDVMSAQALRNLRTYDTVPPPGIVRVAAFGDSFTYGNEVTTAEAWPSMIEAAHRDVEVLNFGVGGYGVDQALLRWQLEGHVYDPHVVVMGFTPDDLRRLVNVYRPFIDPTEFPLAKPRFLLDEGGALRLVPAPLRDTSDYAALLREPRRAARLGAHDQWFTRWRYEDPLHDVSATVRLMRSLVHHVRLRYLDPDRLLDGDEFNPRAEAFRLQVALFAEFAATVEESGRRHVVVMLPDASSLLQRFAGQRASYDGLADSARARGVDVVDAAAAFMATGDADDVPSWFAPGGHYSPTGNVIVARALAGEFRRRGRDAATTGPRATAPVPSPLERYPLVDR